MGLPLQSPVIRRFSLNPHKIGSIKFRQGQPKKAITNSSIIGYGFFDFEGVGSAVDFLPFVSFHSLLLDSRFLN